MEKTYNKLVRDNIPNIIRNKGDEAITRILNDKEYKKELERKLLEEYNEVLNTTNSTERIEELADMLEVIISLARLENKNLNDVIEVANKKSKESGNFNEKIFLEKVIEK